MRLGLAPKPGGTSWRQLYGLALMCGIGFTMSLFIGALAFPGDPARIDAAGIGTLAGSLIVGACRMGRASLAPPCRASSPTIERTRANSSPPTSVRGRWIILS